MLLSIHSYLHDPIQKHRRNLGRNESCLLGPMSKRSCEDWSSPKKYLVIELSDGKNDLSYPRPRCARCGFSLLQRGNKMGLGFAFPASP